MTTFELTDREISLLSDALLCALRCNYEAAKLVSGMEIVNTIGAANAEIRDLNTKLCRIMKEDEA